MMTGALNMTRAGGALGPKLDTGAGGGPLATVTELGKGWALIAANSNTTLDSAIVPDTNAILPLFPTQRDEGTSIGMFSESTNTAPSGGTAHFMVQKDPVTPDQHNYQIRTNNAAGSRTFDWAWYSQPTV